MIDKQVFENEIKCIIRRNKCACNGGSDCIKCDLVMDTEKIIECYNRAIKNIDLINRYKVEIERLQMDNKQLQSDVINANQNYDHIKGLYECEKEKVDSAKQKVICACKMLKTVKSETYKECLAKVKNYIKTHCNPYGKPDFDYDTSIKILNFIDDLQKQRKEDENGSV